MKRAIALFLSVLLAFVCMSAIAEGVDAQQPRTTLLDLSNQTTSTSNSQQGWSFDPHGDSGNPLLTLNSYGNASQHSAPIIVPRNTKILVNGTCYIDNVYMNGPHSVIKGSPDGYLKIDGTGTLNLYAQQYNGKCIELPYGGVSQTAALTYINNVTINCFSMERDMYNAATLEPCIYSFVGIYITNATINTQYGGYGIQCYGYTPIGGVTEETAYEIVIDNSTINIQNYSDNGLWGHAKGLWITYGKMRIVNNSNVTINAGSNSIYVYLSCTIENSNVTVLSMPQSTAEGAGLVRVGSLRLKNTIGCVNFSTVRYAGTTVLSCRRDGESTCENGVNIEVGSFANGNFYHAPDPNNDGLPAFRATGSGSTVIMGDVNGDGSVTTEDALIVLRYSMDIISSIPVMAAADVDGSGVVSTADALIILRMSMGIN